MNKPPNHHDDAQKRQELEDEMSRFEEEISGHTINRPIIGTNTFRQASQTIHDVQVDVNHSNFGQFYQQNSHVPSTPIQAGYPPKDMRGQNMNQAITGQNMNQVIPAGHNMNNVGFSQHSVPMQHVPMQPQFHRGVPQGARAAMPMVPVGMPIMPVGVPGGMSGTAKEHSMITPEEKKEWESTYGKKDNEPGGGKAKKKDKKCVRVAGGVLWEDPSLSEWDPNDFRIFVGDLGNEVTDESLTRAFSKYPSFQKAKVIRERKTNKTKGYGFVSFRESGDFIKAMREMNGKYVGNRPIKLRKSTWKDRSVDVVKKKMKEKKKLGLR